MEAGLTGRDAHRAKAELNDLRSLIMVANTNGKLTWFDIDLHKACNLTCNHCFYHDNYPKSTKPTLAPELLEQAIRQRCKQKEVVEGGGK